MDRATRLTRRRYDRNATMYDLMERMMGRGLMDRWRKQAVGLLRGPRVLEVGVGTGATFEDYPPGLTIHGIDLSPRMLEKARRRADQTGLNIHLQEMDVQNMEFPGGLFDSVLTSCVFCSVPDPVRGLSEIHRVLKPEGRLVMLEHVLTCRPFLRTIMNLANPVAVRLTGANINRDTVANLRRAGFQVEREENLWLDIVKLLVATPTPA